MPQTASTTPIIFTGLKDIKVEIQSIISIPFDSLSDLFHNLIINEESMTDFDSREDVYEAKSLTMILRSEDDPALIKEVSDVYDLCKTHHCKYFRVTYF